MSWIVDAVVDAAEDAVEWVDENVVEPIEEAVEDGIDEVGDKLTSIWDTISNLTWERALTILTAGALLGVAVLVVGPGVTSINWWEADVNPELDVPIHGEYCGPGVGELVLVDDQWVGTTEPVDAVDAVCMQHDICMVDTGDWCVCNMIIFDEMPLAIQEVSSDDNPANNEAAIKAELIVRYFSLQQPVNCIIESRELSRDDLIGILDGAIPEDRFPDDVFPPMP